MINTWNEQFIFLSNSDTKKFLKYFKTLNYEQQNIIEKLLKEIHDETSSQEIEKDKEIKK